MTAAAASNYVRLMVAREQRGTGDLNPALERLSRRYGIGFWQLSHLRKGKAKSVEASLFSRIRRAYLDMCERQVKALLHEIEMDKAADPDGDWTDLESHVRALAEEVATSRQGTAR